MPKTDVQVQALKDELQAWLAKHGFTAYAWHDGKDLTEEQVARGGEKTYFTMGFDEDLYYVFWPLPDVGEKHIRWSNARRREFDRIVAKHRFWTEFDDYTRICFMSVEPKPHTRRVTRA
jgi:hypothetical protein